LPQAARQLGASLERTIELIREGRLRAKLVGGARWFIERESLREFVRARRQRSTDDGRAA